MKKRSHANTSRLTATERADLLIWQIGELMDMDLSGYGLRVTVQRALQAHARETLDRHKRRAAKRG